MRSPGRSLAQRRVDLSPIACKGPTARHHTHGHSTAPDPATLQRHDVARTRATRWRPTPPLYSPSHRLDGATAPFPIALTPFGGVGVLWPYRGRRAPGPLKRTVPTYLNAAALTSWSLGAFTECGPAAGWRLEAAANPPRASGTWTCIFGRPAGSLDDYL